MAEERGKAPMRIWVAAKETVQPRQYESVVAELGIEVDHGTSREDILRAIADAEVIYTVLREKVHAGVLAAKALAAGDGKSAVPARPAGMPSPPGGGWAHQPGKRPERTGRK